MIQKLKFGTDGWRAIIAKDFTTENVARVAKATADWVLQNGKYKKIVIGYDCRFGGYLFCETAINVFVESGISVVFDKHFVSTPMISLAAKKYDCDLGVIITASHNPPTYNGYKLKGNHGGPLIVKYIEEIEAIIPDSHEPKLHTVEELVHLGKVELQDLELLYYNHVNDYFDLESIRDSEFVVGYDAMYGAGQSIFQRILPHADCIHCDYNPSFYGQAPEPIAKNLQPFRNYIREMKHIDFGLATDGDSDRIGVLDNKGNFIDAHHIILMLIHVLAGYKEMTGKVVIAFSVSDKVKKLCDHYGLPYEVTKIGFKYICEKMITEDVLVGGEESGGIAVKGNIPERDGIWDGLVLIEHLANSGTKLNELIAEIYEIVGPFAYNRLDLHLKEEEKQSIIQKCNDGAFTSFGDLKIIRVESIDGHKFHFENEECVMIRASGTEPVLRVYAEGSSAERVEEILQKVKSALLPS